MIPFFSLTNQVVSRSSIIYILFSMSNIGITLDGVTKFVSVTFGSSDFFCFLVFLVLVFLVCRGLSFLFLLAFLVYFLLGLSTLFFDSSDLRVYFRFGFVVIPLSSGMKILVFSGGGSGLVCWATKWHLHVTCCVSHFATC